MTSNLGSEILASRSGALGFVASADGSGFSSQDDVRARVMGKVREAMRPEFLNRIDEIVLFQKLARPQLEQIVRLMLGATSKRLAAREVAFEVTDAAVSLLAERGYEPEYGARPLRRVIQREIDDRIADRARVSCLTAIRSHVSAAGSGENRLQCGAEPAGELIDVERFECVDPQDAGVEGDAHHESARESDANRSVVVIAGESRGVRQQCATDRVAEQSRRRFVNGRRADQRDADSSRVADEAVQEGAGEHLASVLRGRRECFADEEERVVGNLVRGKEERLLRSEMVCDQRGVDIGAPRHRTYARRVESGGREVRSCRIENDAPCLLGVTSASAPLSRRSGVFHLVVSPLQL